MSGEGGRGTSPVSSPRSRLTPSRTWGVLLRLAVVMLCFAPAALMLFDALTGGLAAEPIKDLTHRTGKAGIAVLTATLAVTPLRRLTGFNRLQSYRRMLGLFTLFYIGLHFLVYLVLDQFFDVASILEDITKRPYITIGFAGLLMLSALGVTSTRAWVRRLGRWWARLHALVYVVALAGVVHYTWSQKADVATPTLYGIGLAGLLAVRLVPRRRSANGKAPPGAGPSPARTPASASP